MLSSTIWRVSFCWNIRRHYLPNGYWLWWYVSWGTLVVKSKSLVSLSYAASSIVYICIVLDTKRKMFQEKLEFWRLIQLTPNRCLWFSVSTNNSFDFMLFLAPHRIWTQLHWNLGCNDVETTIYIWTTQGILSIHSIQNRSGMQSILNCMLLKYCVASHFLFSFESIHIIS